MDKKKIISAIVLFVFLGLMIFSFANPAEDDSATKLDGANNSNVQDVDNTYSNDDEEDSSNNSTNESLTTSNDSTGVSTTNTTGNTTTTNNNTNTVTDNTNSNNSTSTDNNTVENYDSIKKMVNDLETMVNNAVVSTIKTDMDEARAFNINEQIEKLVSEIKDEETKEELEAKLASIYVILNDEEEPTVTSLAILNLDHYKTSDDYKFATTNDRIRVLVYFDEELNVLPKMTITGGKEVTLVKSSALTTDTTFVYYYDYLITETDNISDGKLEVKVYDYKDKSNNSGIEVNSNMEDIMHKSYPYVVFDTTIPQLNFNNGNSFSEKLIEVTDENFDYMTIKNMTTGKVEKIYESTYLLKDENTSENTRYDIVAYDKAGNASIPATNSIYLDNVNPVIEGTGLVGENNTELKNNGVYKSVNINVIDVNLNTVKIYKDDVEIDSKSYTWNGDKTCILSYSEDGEYYIYAKDRALNEVELTFTIDNQSAVLGAANILVNGDVNEQTEFWATNGDEIYAYVRVSEKLAENPIFTFHNNGKDYIANSEDIVVSEPNANGEYTYSVLYPITESLDMVDGEITLTVSNLKDLAGNVTDTVLKPTNGHIVKLDRTAPSINWKGTVYGPDYAEVIKTNERFTADIIEIGSGLDKIYQNGADRTSYGKLDVIGHSSYKFRIIDKAGNEAIYNVIVDKTNYVSTFDDLKAAFENGGRIKLMNNIAVEEILVQNEGVDIVLDMNGKKLTIADESVDPMIDMKKGTSLTITGNGTVDLEDHYYNSFIFPRGEVIIENGNFLRNTGGTNYGSFFVGISGSGGTAQLKIYGGYFDAGYYKEGDEFNNSRNGVNVSWGQIVRIYGGTFVGQNPAYGDEGMALTNPASRPFIEGKSYCQGVLLEGQNWKSTEIPSTYEIIEGTHSDGRPTFTVKYTPDN